MSENAGDGERETSDEAPTATGPIGNGEHEVLPGECMISIAHRAGHRWEYLWDHGDNAALQAKRKDPTALLPGDRVHIPPLRLEVRELKTHLRHKYKRIGVPTTIQFVLRRCNEPHRGVFYRLVIDGDDEGAFEGKTSDRGEIKHYIRPDARHARLTLGEREDERVHDIDLGKLDPVTEVSGAQGRLSNLGLDTGTPDGKLGPRTKSALERFQLQEGLVVTGMLDEATVEALEKAYSDAQAKAMR